MEVLAERQVHEERGDDEDVQPPQGTEAGFEHRRGQRAKRRREGDRNERARLVAIAGELEDLGEQLRRDERPDHREDHQRVAVQREPGRLRDEPPLKGPGDRREHDHRDDVLHGGYRRPDHAAERCLQNRLDESARRDVGRPDREQDEAPEDAGVHEAGAEVAEHPRLDDRVLDESGKPGGNVRQRIRGPDRGEDPEVARHHEQEDRQRSVEHREHQWVRGDVAEDRKDHRVRSAG